MATYDVVEVEYRPRPTSAPTSSPTTIIADVERVAGGHVGRLTSRTDDTYDWSALPSPDGAVITDVLPKVVYSGDLHKVFHERGGVYHLREVVNCVNC